MDAKKAEGNLAFWLFSIDDFVISIRSHPCLDLSSIHIISYQSSIVSSCLFLIFPFLRPFKTWSESRTIWNRIHAILTMTTTTTTTTTALVVVVQMKHRAPIPFKISWCRCNRAIATCAPRVARPFHNKKKVNSNKLVKLVITTMTGTLMKQMKMMMLGWIENASKIYTRSCGMFLL
jgi:hypothetical protein